MWSIIWDSTRLSSNLGRLKESMRMDLRTVASMRESREGKSMEPAIWVWSTRVAELWQRGTVSLGFKVVAARECVTGLQGLDGDGLGLGIAVVAAAIGILRAAWKWAGGGEEAMAGGSDGSEAACVVHGGRWIVSWGW